MLRRALERCPGTFAGGACAPRAVQAGPCPHPKQLVAVLAEVQAHHCNAGSVERSLANQDASCGDQQVGAQVSLTA